MKKGFIMESGMQNWDYPIATRFPATFRRISASWASCRSVTEPVESVLQVGDEVGNLLQSDMQANQRPVVRNS